MWYMKPPSSVKMVVHSRVMGLTQRMSDYSMSGKSVGLEEDLHRMNVVVELEYGVVLVLEGIGAMLCRHRKTMIKILKTIQIKLNIIMHLSSVDRQVSTFSYIAEIWDFVISVNKIHGKLWGDDMINSLICIFIATVQEMLRWKLRKFKVHIFFFIRFTSHFHCSVKKCRLIFYWFNLKETQTHISSLLLL